MRNINKPETGHIVSLIKFGMSEKVEFHHSNMCSLMRGQLT